MIQDFDSSFGQKPHCAAVAQTLFDRTNMASAVWAGTAYRSPVNAAFLARNGFVSHIHRKKPKRRIMPDSIRRANNTNSKTRSLIRKLLGCSRAATSADGGHCCERDVRKFQFGNRPRFALRLRGGLQRFVGDFVGENIEVLGVVIHGSDPLPILS
jgi:hypothetical protein